MIQKTNIANSQYRNHGVFMRIQAQIVAVMERLLPILVMTTMIMIMITIMTMITITITMMRCTKK